MHLFKSTYPTKAGRKKSRFWSVEYDDNRGIRRRRSLRTTDRAIAEERMRTLKRKLLLEREGVATLRELEAAELPLTHHVTEYIKLIRRRGRTERYARDVERRLNRLLDGLALIKDLETVELRVRLQELRQNRQLSGTTTNRYRTALHGLCRHLMETGAMHSNPAKSIRPEPTSAPADDRRALTAAELKTLLDSSPEERARVYRVATMTGLRRSELKALTWLQVDLNAGVIYLKSGQAKNRRSAVMDLAGEVVKAISTVPEARRQPNQKVFPRMPSVKVLRRDLKAAGVPPETAEGYVDFHALRVTFCTLLARAGVPLAQAQKLMRHSDPRQTANIYSRFNRRESRAAIEKASQLICLEEFESEETALEGVDTFSRPIPVLPGETEEDWCRRAVESDLLPLIRLINRGAPDCSFGEWE